MHWKTRKKLESTDRVYLTTESSIVELTYQARIKLPTEEYVLLELHLPIPSKVEYQSLKYGGFNYKPAIDPPMTHYSKKRTIKILNDSKEYRDNNANTIDTLIALVLKMNEF